MIGKVELIISSTFMLLVTWCKGEACGKHKGMIRMRSGVWGRLQYCSSKEERIGIRASYRESEWEEFKYFIEDMELFDVPYIGGQYTWYNGAGNGMSRLDHFLLSVNLVSI